jgi:hypothetical protein
LKQREPGLPFITCLRGWADIPDPYGIVIQVGVVCGHSVIHIYEKVYKGGGGTPDVPPSPLQEALYVEGAAGGEPHMYMNVFALGCKESSVLGPPPRPPPPHPLYIGVYTWVAREQEI